MSNDLPDVPMHGSQAVEIQSRRHLRLPGAHLDSSRRRTIPSTRRLLTAVRRWYNSEAGVLSSPPAFERIREPCFFR
jgi:hypothetical protein